MIIQFVLIFSVATLPIISSLSTTTTTTKVVSSSQFPTTLPIPTTTDARKNSSNSNNVFVSARIQFQRRDLKRKLISATRRERKDNDDNDAESLILSLAEELSKFNPTDCPTQGLAGYDGGAGTMSGKNSRPPLDGSWRLLFTNAKDAQPPTSRSTKDATLDEKNGEIEVTTGQTIDAMKGECVNYIAFNGNNDNDRPPPFDRLDITIKLTPLNDKRVRLDFLRGRAMNQNAPLPFLRDFEFSFPPAVVGDILATIRGKDPRIEPQAYFDILYIDDQLRVHRTGEGKIFIQERV